MKIKCLPTLNPKLGKVGQPTISPMVKRDRGRPWMMKRARVLERDGYLCQECVKQGRVTLAKEVDHIVPLGNGGNDNEENLQSLCCACHAAKTKAENLERR